MRGLAQALLLAPALVGAAPSRIAVEKAQTVSPSTVVTFDITPAAILEVAGDVRLSDHRPPAMPPKPLPEFERHDPRPGDDEDRLLEDPPFPPPPHHRVGDHPDNRPGEHHGEKPPPHHHHRPPPPPPPGRHMSSEEEEHVRLKLHELDCLRHQLHALQHAIHAKESHLAQEHGILPPPHHRALGDCDSLRCIFETLARRVRGEGRGRCRHHHRPHHDGPPASCPGFPFPGHGNHGKGNHTLPPPPPGSCHCPPSPPEGPPEGPPPPPDHEPHRGPPGHHRPPPPPPPRHPFDWLFHGPPPPPPPPPGFHPHGPPLGLEHPHGPPGLHHPPPPPPGFHGHGLPLPVNVAAATLLLIGVLALARAVIYRLSSRLASRRARRARHRRNKEAFKASLADFWSRISAHHHRRGGPSDADDEEKRAFLPGGVDAGRLRPSTSSDEGGDFESVESMTSEITQFRNAATLVTEMVAAEERRQGMREQQKQQQQVPTCCSPRHAGPGAVAAPPGPTAAFADYMGDDVLPAYDEHAPSLVVSDGFSSYSPGSSDYEPGASSDTASNIDSVLGDPKN